MTELVTNVDVRLASAFPRRELSIDTDLIMDTLVLMGEDIDADNPPIHINFFPNTGAGHNATARKVNTIEGHREINIALCLVPPLDGKVGEFYARNARLKREGIVNETLVHELVHAVDFLDDALYQEHQDYYDKLFERSIKVGRLTLRPLITDHKYRNSPLEKRAFSTVAKLRKAHQIPSIVQYLRKPQESIR